MKGKGGGPKGDFQGSCYWCGKWGHTASRCHDKDTYMAWVRSGKGSNLAEAPQEVHNVQVDSNHGWKTVGGPLASLDPGPRFVDVCSLRTNYEKDYPSLKNKFSALQSEDRDTEDEVENTVARKMVTSPRPKRTWR